MWKASKVVVQHPQHLVHNFLHFFLGRWFRLLRWPPLKFGQLSGGEGWPGSCLLGLSCLDLIPSLECVIQSSRTWGVVWYGVVSPPFPPPPARRLTWWSSVRARRWASVMSTPVRNLRNLKLEFELTLNQAQSKKSPPSSVGRAPGS